MILRCGQRQYMLTVHHHNKAGFFTGHEFFNHDAVAGIAEFVARQHIFHRCNGFSFRLGDNHTFTGCQAIGLDHNRRTLLVDVVFGLLDIGENLIGRCRDLMTCQKVLGKAFRCFQFSSGLAGTKAFQTRSFERINHTHHQWHFRADHGQIDGIVFGIGHQAFNILDLDIDIADTGLIGGAGVTRCNKDLRLFWRVTEFPGQRVFAPATADNKNFHRFAEKVC